MAPAAGTTPSALGTTTLARDVLRLAVRAGRAILDVYLSGDFDVERKADSSPLTRADRTSHDLIDSGLRSLTPGVPVLSEEGAHLPFAERSAWGELWLVDPLDGTKEFLGRNGEFTVNIALVRGGDPVFGVVYAPVLGTAWVGFVVDAPPPPAAGAWKLTVADPDEIGGQFRLERSARPVRVKTREPSRIVVAASRSHLDEATREYIEQARAGFTELERVTVGSSIKLCLVAEGSADLYPRFGPTSEWDTAAGHAIVLAAGGVVVEADDERRPLRYNKESLLNPSFVARAW